MAEWLVLSVGGGIINPEGTPDLEFVKKLAKTLCESKYNFGIVTGGGRNARMYAQAVRDLGANEFRADEIAILSTKQNALLLITALGEKAYPKVILDFEEARLAALSRSIVIMGGTIPGITTDTDSALLAETLGAKKLVNLSNVDAIYDSDPKTNPNAKKYSELSYADLILLATKNDKRIAGTNFVFDSLACKIIARSKIETHFVNGKNLDDVKKAIEGKVHTGTIIV